jgi:hypothetical protein
VPIAVLIAGAVLKKIKTLGFGGPGLYSDSNSTGSIIDNSVVLLYII